MIRITTRDVGLTPIATVFVGETEAIEFFTHTRHPDISKEIAENVVAKALRQLIVPILAHEDCALHVPR